MKDEWLKALRSGDYTQAKSGHLRNKNSYCALGVLAEIHPDLEWEMDVFFGQEGDMDVCHDKVSGHRSRLYLPERVIPRHFQNDIGKLNSKQESTFEKIAQFIEKAWKENER